MDSVVEMQCVSCEVWTRFLYPEDGILNSHCRENSKSYNIILKWVQLNSELQYGLLFVPIFGKEFKVELGPTHYRLFAAACAGHLINLRVGKMPTVQGAMKWESDTSTPLSTFEMLNRIFLWRIPFSGKLRRVALVRTYISEEFSASFIKVTTIGELGTTLAVTSNRRTLRRNTY
jgi:hypothetical protein